MTKEKTDKLEEAIQAINKQFGKGTVISMDKSRAADPVEVISTGNAAIDDLTGIGGVPKSRITEIYGAPSGGKSTLCLQIVREAQRQGGRCFYADAENALDVGYAEKLGIDVNSLLIGQPSCGEDALASTLMMIQSNMISVAVVDSVAALVPRSELEGDMGDAQMGLMARMMSQAMRKMNDAVAHSDCALIFVNQVRSKIGMVFGNPQTTTGGVALSFYASLRMEVTRATQIKKGDDVVGHNAVVKTWKNKLASPHRKVEVPLIYGLGFQNG